MDGRDDARGARMLVGWAIWRGGMHDIAQQQGKDDGVSWTTGAALGGDVHVLALRDLLTSPD